MNKQRLLNVARALRESPNPDKFDMEREVDSICGTPMCAWGHYAARTDLQGLWRIRQRPDRWYFAIEFASVPPDDSEGIEIGDVACYDDVTVCQHFDIHDDQLEKLFEPGGCGGATTAIEAAEFIERFVAEHKGAECKWCGNVTDNASRKCDACLRELETDRRIDERRGK